ncbi:hypothetical protein DO021_04760 [Desulfobacter hydrogenophilus]|uniref:Uncharacterized protein n=1 Tax=Desulfobacter hydrogenophilus TaxID=2291 RepID=A0A328FJ27_9BACT|nr:hypothetical protein EYB58_01025 [Desulfobacter hydrogenophilus]RAM03173.1 hypothetical protein DO021_04760 [Desulfobacter hydrogenophilus]
MKNQLFPHITRVCKGFIFKNIEIINDFMAKTKTSTELKIFTSILDKNFETGRKVADGFKKI